MDITSQESYFSFDELFYSKTDKKGIILAGNSVFQRVSELPWGDLINRPHNVIRHPDMPRGVFHLLWDYLKSDKPIGAFVKNRSKTGKYYWVFALAMPFEDGYVSVRLKPGGSLLSLIEKEYSTLKMKEVSEKLSPEDSQSLLLKRISELGFSDYSAFMTYALSNQIENRCHEMKIKSILGLKLMADMQDISKTILEDATRIFEAHKNTKFVPLNLEVNSARLGQDGRQISVVANQYQKMVEEINQEINSFELMSREVTSKIEMGQFYVGASQLMQDVVRFLKSEGKSEKANDRAQDLVQLASHYLKSSEKGLYEIANVLDRFKNTCESLQTMSSGLELVRMTGKIETARLNNANDISSMLDELKEFQTSLSSGIKKILNCQELLTKNSKHLNDEIVSKIKESGAILV